MGDSEKDLDETVKIAMIDIDPAAKERLREIMESAGREVEIIAFSTHPYDRDDIGERFRQYCPDFMMIGISGPGTHGPGLRTIRHYREMFPEIPIHVDSLYFSFNPGISLLDPMRGGVDKYALKALKFGATTVRPVFHPRSDDYLLHVTKFS